LLNNPKDHDALVGHPYASAYDSQWVIPVARTLYNTAGQSLGVVSVDIRLAYFGALYSRVAKENNASVTLLSDQGFIIARSPFEARYVDRDVSDEPRLLTLRSDAVEGSFDDASFLDDDPGAKLYTYRKLNGFPVTTARAGGALTYFLIFSISGGCNANIPCERSQILACFASRRCPIHWCNLTPARLLRLMTPGCSSMATSWAM
jgi:hypothetical protein